MARAYGRAAASARLHPVEQGVGNSDLVRQCQRRRLWHNNLYCQDGTGRLAGNTHSYN